MYHWLLFIFYILSFALLRVFLDSKLDSLSHVFNLSFQLIGIADDGRNLSSFIRGKFSITVYGSNPCRICFYWSLVINLYYVLQLSNFIRESHSMVNTDVLFFHINLIQPCSSFHTGKVYFHEFCQFLEMCETCTGQFLQMVWWIGDFSVTLLMDDWMFNMWFHL